MSSIVSKLQLTVRQFQLKDKTKYLFNWNPNSMTNWSISIDCFHSKGQICPWHSFQCNFSFSFIQKVWKFTFSPFLHFLSFFNSSFQEKEIKLKDVIYNIFINFTIYSIFEKINSIFWQKGRRITQIIFKDECHCDHWMTLSIRRNWSPLDSSIANDCRDFVWNWFTFKKEEEPKKKMWFWVQFQVEVKWVQFQNKSTKSEKMTKKRISKIFIFNLMKNENW